MAGRPGDVPRTQLEYLLWREERSYSEMATQFEAVARSLGEQATITDRHLRRLASGERQSATPVTRRVFQAMFGQSLDVLLGPWQGESPVAGTVALNDREMLEMAANPDLRDLGGAFALIGAWWGGV